MWVPFRRLEHAFDDPLTPEDCRRYVGYVRTTRGAQVVLVPVVAATLTAGGGFALLMLSRRFGWFPVPFMHSPNAGVWLACLSLGTFGAVWLLLRDYLLWRGVRAEVERARCPKCRHSLQGLRVEEIGTGLDPTKRFVRCVECGRKYRLMDLGLTPMDLVPFEQRVVPEDFARKRLPARSPD